MGPPPSLDAVLFDLDGTLVVIAGTEEELEAAAALPEKQDAEHGTIVFVREINCLRFVLSGEINNTMDQLLTRLIDDFQERGLPVPTPRDLPLAEVDGKASTLIGMRRVGKTWTCFERIHSLLSEGIDKQRILYLNFEDERLLPFTAADFQVILDCYYARFPHLKDARCFVFFDEIQRIEGWEMFIRRLLDTENLSVWITGSSSKLLSTEIATSLRGRSLSTEVFPLSFAEYLRFHGAQIPIAGRYGSRARAEMQNQVRQYLVRGGFPEIQSIAEEDVRRQTLRDYVDVMILRDVVERHSIRNVTALRHLVRHLLAAPTSRFSVSRFYNGLRSRGVQCTKNDLYLFLGHLQDAYLVFPIPIHSRSEKARQVNPRKVYVIDNGLLEAHSFGMTEDRGALLENMVHLRLRSLGQSPEYYVTRSGAEVDFVVPGRRASDRRLVQVCWSLSSPATREREVRSLREAMQELRLKEGTIVTWSEDGHDEGITLVPAWKWLLEHS